MEQIAKVQKVFSDGTAEVIRLPEESCSGNCTLCSGCQEQKPVLAKNSIGAQPGERVTLEPDARTARKTAAMLYTIPPILLLTGYLLGEHLWSKGALVGLACGVVGMWIVLLLDRKMSRKNPITYVISGKMTEKGDNIID